jgi:hypothetical protein
MTCAAGARRAARGRFPRAPRAAQIETPGAQPLRQGLVHGLRRSSAGGPYAPGVPGRERAGVASENA